MTKITNLTRENLDFHVGGLDDRGEPNMDHVAPGQTKSLSVDIESPEVKARLNAGLITIESAATKTSAAKKGSKKPAAASEPKPDPSTEPVV